MAIRGKKVKGYKRHAGSLWIENNRADLEKKYPNEWVATDGKGLVLHDATQEGIMKKIDAKKIKTEKLAIGFMQTDSL